MFILLSFLFLSSSSLLLLFFIFVVDLTFCSLSVHTEWLPWGPWGPCSVTCGYGSHTRQRICPDNNCQPLISPRSMQDAALGGCRLKRCGKWLEWTSWSACSVTCGGGRRRRTRECSRGICDHASNVTYSQQTCNNNPCSTRMYSNRPLI